MLLYQKGNGLYQEILSWKKIPKSIQLPKLGTGFKETGDTMMNKWPTLKPEPYLNVYDDKVGHLRPAVCAESELIRTSPQGEQAPRTGWPPAAYL